MLQNVLHVRLTYHIANNLVILNLVDDTIGTPSSGESDND